jgi:hypothetical protein
MRRGIDDHGRKRSTGAGTEAYAHRHLSGPVTHKIAAEASPREVHAGKPWYSPRATHHAFGQDAEADQTFHSSASHFEA